ncbi:MAG TPA: glycoside hydrolase family 27 protein [Lacipirellulaceae bacterium]|jgi:alpha-galactosidase
MNRLFFAVLVGCSVSAPALAQKFDGLAQTPPMGWNSWNTFNVHIDEKLIKEMATAIEASGMHAAGYEYIVLDDAWLSKERDADGNLQGDPKRFPSGMKALGDYLHEKGFKFGIYNCAGTKTCAGYPGGYQHEEADAKMYASWGVDYLKYDWCNTEHMDAKERYKAMRDALHAAGRPIVFSMCEWGTSKPWTWAADVGHLWRTTGDIAPIWDGTPQKQWENPVMKLLHQNIGLETYAGPGHWNDPDMLEVGNKGLTETESRSHFSLWCMLAAPLMAGNDVRKMTPEIRAIMTDQDVIAIDQDPLGKQGSCVSAEKGREIWVKELSDGAQAVCILNTTEEPMAVKLDWKTVEPIAGKKYAIRDLWTKKDAGTPDADFEATIDSHGVALLRLSPVTN